jgi:glycosyltransferase involved in cell wall biosynthesis
VNILSLTSSYPRYDGDPTAPFVESITRHVAALGHTMHVVLPENQAWARPASEGGVTFHSYRYSLRRSWTPWGYSESLERGVSVKPALFALAPVVALSAFRTASRLLARERFDLVHAHWVIPNGVIAALAARRSGLPIVVSLHGSDLAVSEKNAAFGRAARSAFARAAAVTAPSDDLLERARRLGAREPLESIPYGADVQALTAAPGEADRLRTRLGLTPERVVVAGVGRFIDVKGFSYLIDAVAAARPSCPELHLVLVGDGDLREELEARARALGLSGSVEFPGIVGRDEIAAYFASAQIVVVPSVHAHGLVDGLPNVALEAMAAGKPLIATKVGGLPQLVRDGENGLLVEEKDPAGLATAILSLANDPALRARLGERARAEIRDQRSWDVVARQFVEVFEHAVENSRGQTPRV